MSSWINEILKGTDHVETPEQWKKWGLYAAIAAVASPIVWLDKQGAYPLSPNIYVMLLGESGVGKGFPVWLAKSLVQIVDNTRVFTGRNSIQKIVTDLSMAHSRGKGKEMIKDGRAFLASGEFVNFLLRDDQAISIITEWYDTHYVTNWPNSLKSSGTETIKDVNITLLGASTRDYLRESVPVAAIKGGFFGRLMLIYAGGKGKLNALFDEPKEEEKIQPKLKDWAKHLQEIAKLKTKHEMKPTEEARCVYRQWYYPLQENIRDGKIVDKTGYAHRIHDHALKVAMVLSLSESLDLIIHRRHIEEAIALVTDLMATVKTATLGIGLSESAAKNEVFLRSLFRAEGSVLSRRQMLQFNSSDFDSNDCDRIALTMEDAGFVKLEGTGTQAQYRLTPLGKKQFLDIQAELKRRKN